MPGLCENSQPKYFWKASQLWISPGLENRPDPSVLPEISHLMLLPCESPTERAFVYATVCRHSENLLPCVIFLGPAPPDEPIPLNGCYTTQMGSSSAPRILSDTAENTGC